ncbi:DNA repair protein RecN [Bacteroides pyogenes DSM 20611 = JCM 6294]|uniref:DNA repair protein RecN n=1 Tax=Bacteroides pyogenes DSM 20611 = JCM 6294 TaxID=1121100 RepID=W4PJJ0_9BACE|nr:DNA repair protein RecN [Bacteroides pyogenes DSM 20611 = JCM 6294]
MLRSLYIQNYALIEKLDIGFDSGFSVVTGETGAGKSIMLGAIGLLLGQRADVKAIRLGASKCVIERVSTFPPTGCVLSSKKTNWSTTGSVFCAAKFRLPARAGRSSTIRRLHWHR